MSEAPPPHFRTVRSYVRRSGRVTNSQARALSEYWPRFGLDFNSQTVDLDVLFGRTALRTLEIGFGNGEHLLARAVAEPERDFLGVEVHRSGVGQLLNAAMAAALNNIRVACHDAIEVLKAQIAVAALDEVQILFPDPWPKERHHKRRLIQPEFVELLAMRLRSGGRLLLATDWAPYAEHMQMVLDACPLFERLDPGTGDARAATLRALTRFERRGLQLGHTVSDFSYRRRG
ncbi:MAG: tRNA (guanosine(46)-N7)-methyltransferase TrmB [Steroidobacteraceae bacterium]